MRIVFAGTPEFAAVALRALLAAGHNIIAVYTQPDRPAGRGQQLRSSPVKEVALAHGLPVVQPLNFKAEEDRDSLAALHCDLMIVAAYGLILPPAVLAMPTYGCVNIHASLLPRWRGAAPIQRAIEAGDAQTGVGIMHMEAGLDTGPIYCAQSCPIMPSDNAQTLHDRLAVMGGELILEFLSKRQNLVAHPQSSEGVVYARKIDKRESLLCLADFANATHLAHKIQALSPSPGAVVFWRGERVKLLDVTAQEHAQHAHDSDSMSQAMATILNLDQGLKLACGVGCLHVARVHAAGGKAQAAHEWAKAQGAKVGDVFQLSESLK